MTVVNDYRVSKIVVLCKDCGQDVGLYPARHKCEQVIHPPLPPLPALPTETTLSSPAKATVTRRNMTMRAPRSNDEQWKLVTRSNTVNNARSRDQQEQEQENESIYFDKYAAHLPNEPSTGKRLWGKVRGNETLKQLGAEKQKGSVTLWNKLLDRVSEKLPASYDDNGPESDDSDWEGETHVSRVLREYYEKKGAPLPSWLLDERTPQRVPRDKFPVDRDMTPTYKEEELARRPSRRNRKLWEVDDEQQNSRESERPQQALDPIREKDNRYDLSESQSRRRQMYSGFEQEEDARPSAAANKGSRQDIVNDIYNDYYSSGFDNYVARSRSERRPTYGTRSNTVDDMPSARLARQKTTLEHRRGKVYF